MKLYPTEKALYDSCKKSEAHITVIAMPLFNEEGELLGYYKHYVD